MTHSQELRFNEAQRREPLQRRINPTADGNESCAGTGRRDIPFAAHDLADRSPFRAAEFRIVMPAVNILRDEIADQAADEHVRGKCCRARTREKSTVAANP